MKKLLFIILILVWGGINATAQNIGIATDNPTRGKLEVIGAAGVGNTMALFGSGANGVSLQRNWPTIGFNQYRDDILGNGKYIGNGYAAIQYLDITTGALCFDMFPSGTANSLTNAGTRALTIFNNGNTAIRTTYSGASLNVARGDGADGTAVFAGPQHWSHIHYGVGEDTYIRAGVDGGTVFINKTTNSSVLMGTTSTHLGINSPNPFYTIEVFQPGGQKAFGMVDVNGYRWSMATNFLNTLNNGMGVALDLYYNNAGKGRFQYWDGVYIVLSDQRVKKDIQAFEPVLDKMKKLNPVRYEMINYNPKHEKNIGMIAQEVRPLFPTLVHQVVDHNNGKPVNDALVMDYTGFGVIAIKALQEQEGQILALQKEKEGLLARLKSIEAKLAGH